MLDGVVWDVVFALLVVWATTGLTIIHLGVIAVRSVRSLSPRRGGRKLPARFVAPPEKRATLTFVVPVYNDASTVGPTIESLLRQTVPPDRILVVDDGSTDGTGAAIDAFRARGVDVLHLPGNVGKSRALDAGLKTVTTELVAITDADSIVDARYVEEMHRSFQDPQLAAVGGAVESIPHTWVTAARQIEYMLTVNVDRAAETEMNALVVLPGVSTTYRTAVLKEMGFEFDTIAEDFDMTFRLQRAGRKIAMNLRAKVHTSDPPTLRMYGRQLMRWYTDLWLVLKKHRSVLGKRVFGTLEVPMMILNSVVSSALYFVLPVWLAWRDPERLVWFFATGVAMDVFLVVVAWRIYRRRDLWWALLSRTPTRAIGRATFLVAMARVLVNRPGRAWTKLERRGTSDFLHGARRRAPRAMPVAAASTDPYASAVWWCALALVVAGGVALPLIPFWWALGLAGAGAAALLLRALARALSQRATPPRVAALVGGQTAFLAVAAWSSGVPPFHGPLAWRIVAMVTAAQVVLALVAPRPADGRRAAAVALGHLGVVGGSMALLLGVAPLVVVCAYASSAGVLASVSVAGRIERAVALTAAGASLVAFALALLPSMPLEALQTGQGVAIVAGGVGVALVASPPWARPERAAAEPSPAGAAA